MNLRYMVKPLLASALIFVTVKLDRYVILLLKVCKGGIKVTFGRRKGGEKGKLRLG